jgi:ABC-2 type transport system ATP-binding protein
LIRVEGLWAGYRTGFRRAWRDVLRGVGFHVPRGAVAGYLGVNGAGKTTTIKVLVGINPPARGTVEIDGAPAGSSAARARVGFLPESPTFYDSLSGRELLLHLGRLSGKGRAALAARIDPLLDQVGLARAAADQPLRSYSKGMRQRLGLAQALVHEPDLLVLDEPLDGLDAMGRLQLRELIAAQGRAGKTVLFSTHVLADVEAICDHLVVLDAGVIAYQGPPTGLVAGTGLSVELELGGLEGEDALAAVAEAAGAALERRGGGRVALRCPGLEQANRAADAARARGGQVLLLSPHRPGLEELFLARFRAAAGAGA